MGRPARIDRGAVLAAALAVADEHGLAGVTLAAVAARLGVTPMALYRHVPGKEALLDGLVEALLDEIGPDGTVDAGMGGDRVGRDGGSGDGTGGGTPPAADRSPRDRLALAAADLRAVARRHPAVFPLLLHRPAATPGARRARDAIHTALAEAGVPPSRVARTERLLSSAVIGFAASEVSGRFAHLAPDELDGDFARLVELLGALIDVERTTGPGGAAPTAAGAGPASATPVAWPGAGTEGGDRGDPGAPR